MAFAPKGKKFGGAKPAGEGKSKTVGIAYSCESQEGGRKYVKIMMGQKDDPDRKIYLMFPNDFKEKETDPDFKLVLQEKKPE